MKESDLIRAVEEAVILDRDIARKAERLKELKAVLIHEGATRKKEHVATGNGGRAWRFEGESGSLCNVVFPAPTIRSALTGEAVADARKLAGRAAPSLFIAFESLKPVADFRAAAAAALGKKAARLIAACEMESAPRVSFETKRVVVPGTD